MELKRWALIRHAKSVCVHNIMCGHDVRVCICVCACMEIHVYNILAKKEQKACVLPSTHSGVCVVDTKDLWRV